MPIYQYQAEDGEVIEKTMSMKASHPSAILRDANGKICLVYEDTPTIMSGEEAGFDPSTAKRFARVFGNCLVNDMGHAQYPYPSLRMAGKIKPEDAEIKDTVVRGVPHEQVPIIRSRQHEREIMAKYNLRRE